MGLAKFRADRSEKQRDGAVLWFADWIGGKTLTKVENCRLVNLVGDMRSTVHVQGPADTYFSIPARCSHAGCVVEGYLTSEDGQLVFRHTYYWGRK